MVLGSTIPSSRRVHDRLAIALSECPIKAISVILCQVVPHEWLPSVLIDPLQDFVCGGVSQAGE